MKMLEVVIFSAGNFVLVFFLFFRDGSVFETAFTFFEIYNVGRENVKMLKKNYDLFMENLSFD